MPVCKICIFLGNRGEKGGWERAGLDSATWSFLFFSRGQKSPKRRIASASASALLLLLSKAVVQDRVRPLEKT